MHGLLAESLFRQQKFDEAIAHYQQFLAYRPADVAAQVQLGIAYAALGRQDDAIAQFRRVVDLNPQDAVAHRNLARALLETGNLDEAALALRRAVELNPAPTPRSRGGARSRIARKNRCLHDPNDAEVRHLGSLAAKAARRPERVIIPYEALHPGRRRHPAVPRDGAGRPAPGR